MQISETEVISAFNEHNGAAKTPGPNISSTEKITWSCFEYFDKYLEAKKNWTQMIVFQLYIKNEYTFIIWQLQQIKEPLDYSVMSSIVQTRHQQNKNVIITTRSNIAAHIQHMEGTPTYVHVSRFRAKLSIFLQFASNYSLSWYKCSRWNILQKDR